MSDFDWSKLTQWKLLEGSHRFPGPEGGTCINEAAIVAAGLPYRAVGGANDLPDCFSKMCGMFALSCNDIWKLEERQKLMPFVFRLAGSATDIVTEARRIAWAYRVAIKAELISDYDMVRIALTLQVYEHGTEPMLRELSENYPQEGRALGALFASRSPALALRVLDGMLKVGHAAPVDEHIAVQRLVAKREQAAAKAEKVKRRQMVDA